MTTPAVPVDQTRTCAPTTATTPVPVTEGVGAQNLTCPDEPISATPAIAPGDAHDRTWLEDAATVALDDAAAVGFAFGTPAQNGQCGFGFRCRLIGANAPDDTDAVPVDQNSIWPLPAATVVVASDLGLLVQNGHPGVRFSRPVAGVMGGAGMHACPG